MKTLIYGAQAIALGAYNAIRRIKPTCHIEGFLVTQIGYNARQLAGLPVIELNDYINGITDAEKDNTEVFIATPEDIFPEIEKTLDAVGIKKHKRLDSLTWAKLMDESGMFDSLADLPINGIDYTTSNLSSDFTIFRIHHERDKKLKGAYKLPECIWDLQVGAANSQNKLTKYQDNTGDNISIRNGDYCELTGLYWMWKNIVISNKSDRQHWYGMYHYRRLLNLSDDDMVRIRNNKIDAILPYPMPYEPSMESHHKRYLTDIEWDAVVESLHELSPDLFVNNQNNLEHILSQPYMYNYNIVLAKKNVLADYCSWLFQILFSTEKIVKEIEGENPHRYIGYAAETLETIYFMHHEIKKKNVGCWFLV